VPQMSAKTPSGQPLWFLYELLELQSEVEASLVETNGGHLSDSVRSKGLLQRLWMLYCLDIF
jgi:hypothetical protein